MVQSRVCDRAEQLADEVARDGLCVVVKEPARTPGDQGGRAFITRNLQRLGLNLDVVKSPGRPVSGRIGWRGND